MSPRMTILACLAAAAPALALHQDIHLDHDGTKLITGVIDLDLPDTPIVPNVRVFGRELNEQGIPGFTDDPGFNSPSGTFPSGMLIGFAFTDAARKWDPVEGNFDEIPAEFFRVSLFGTFADSPAVPPVDPVFGFNFTQVGGSGGIHQHINFVLTPAMEAGIYLLTIQVTGTGFEPSDPVFLAFNNNAPAEELDAAVAYLEDQLAPSCSGDANGDGSTDAADLSVLIGNFGASVPAGTGGDLNGDGSVDAADLSVLIGGFGCSEG